MTTTEATRAAYVAQARYLGADAALAAASWLVMSESQALAVVRGASPELPNDLGGPNLSGEWADDLTPELLAEEVGLTRERLTICTHECDLVDAIADAWEEGRDLVWWDAVRAVALRITGDIATASRIEAVNEHNVDVLGDRADESDQAAR